MSGIINSTGAKSGIIGTTVGTPAAGATEGTAVSFTDITASGDIDMADDKGIKFGTGDDFWFGLSDDELGLSLYSGSTQGRGSEEGEMTIFAGGASARSKANFISGEGEPLEINCWADEGDDTNDQWQLFFQTNGHLYFNNGSNTVNENINLGPTGDASADGVWNDNSWDYAELFEWKTHLATDDAVKELYGMSVVLEDGKVRVAEPVDEDNILGVVRAKGSTATHGDGLQWQGKYKKDVWGEYEMENYIQVTWNEYLPNGNISFRHSYMKYEIPSYRLKENIGRDKDNHLKESNFLLDKAGEKISVIVPSTDEEKTLTNYSERNYVKSDPDRLLVRRKFRQDYDESIEYIKKTDRPKQWVLIGLLGQVPVNTSTVIPAHWKKFYSLESGVDKYYIYNK